MFDRRRRTAALLTLSATVVVAGCSAEATAPESPASPSSAATSTAAGHRLDLSRLSELEDEMPPGFDVVKHAAVEKLHPAYVASVGSVVSGSGPFTADPPQCGVLLKPVEGVGNSESIGFRADAAEKRAIAVGAYVPVNVPADIPATGCGRMTYTVPDDERPRTGTAERIAVPAIEGATTVGLKITADGFGDPEYYYAAIIDNRVYVNVSARVAPDFEAQPLVPDLLVKAVAAIRGS